MQSVGTCKPLVPEAPSSCCLGRFATTCQSSSKRNGCHSRPATLAPGEGHWIDVTLEIVWVLSGCWANTRRRVAVGVPLPRW